MIIQTSPATDPDTMNFYPPQPIASQEKIEFIDIKSIRRSPLAEKIFDLGSISFITIHHDLISVTKEKDISWDDLKPQIMAEIMDFITTGQTAVTEQDASSSADTIKKITALLEARIRPAIRMDGGDILFKHFHEGIVYVELQGNCVGCPYALVTLKDGVERMLKTYIPEVKSVENYIDEAQA
ncbi:MAG: NifU family protein [Lactobacillus sp.]|jgi:Fe-S cluster biogenesis protein NfuA|nr:NifU family protein [Lactobacillus sp.]